MYGTSQRYLESVKLWKFDNSQSLVYNLYLKMLVYRWEQSAYDNQCQPFLPQRNLYVVEIMLEELSKKTHERLIQNLL